MARRDDDASEDAPGENASIDWQAHYFDPRLNRESVSRPFTSKEGALRHACDLIHRKCAVRFIEGPDRQRIQPPAIAAWCKANRTAERPKDPA